MRGEQGRRSLMLRKALLVSREKRIEGAIAEYGFE